MSDKPVNTEDMVTIVRKKDEMLDEQEKKDLVRLYKKWKAHNKKLEQKFLEVLKCAGCEEELECEKEKM